MKGFLENIYVSRELHSVVFESICSKYHLTYTEVLVLLLLSNQEVDTAKDIVHKYKIAKSHVSASIRDLEEKGYIEGKFEGHDRRTIHLSLCESANEILNELEDVQVKFTDVIMKDFSEIEKNQLRDFLTRMTNNVNCFLNDLDK